MIHEVDESLRAFITGDGAGGGVDVSFESPTRDWSARRSGPAVNVFLYDIREDFDRRSGGRLPVRHQQGHTVGRRQPVRQFKLAYLVSAWTQRPEDEHRLLAGLLTRFLGHDQLPAEHLRGSLAQTEYPVLIGLAQQTGPDRSPSDLWNALGGELKPSLDLVVTAPLDPQRTYDVGPPVLEDPVLGAAPTDSDGRPARRTVTPGPDGGDDVVAGGDKPGRAIAMRRIERHG